MRESRFGGWRRVGGVVMVCLTLAGVGWAQTRSMAQDPSLDNLAHPPGYQPAPVGKLGSVRKVGGGPEAMILIPGLGFGGAAFDEFMARRTARYTMYAVTLPGFGGTPGLPMPASGTSIGELPWTRSNVAALVALMDRERLPRVTVVAHWIYGSQLALRLALDHPDRIAAVVLIGGVLKSYYSNTPGMSTWTPAQRVRAADQTATGWFKTVTRRTWDDQNFMSYDYAVHPLRALFLWREAAEPSLPVWIRYLLEFSAQDLGAELSRLRVPTLVVRPGFDDPAMFVEAGRPYMKDLTHDSWRGVEGTTSALEFVTISGARLFVMFDKPDELDSAVDGFLARHR